MKSAVLIIFFLILTGCVSQSSVEFSLSQNYAVSVQSHFFDAVRITNNDITLFNEGRALGFVRLEPVPTDAPSTSEFINTLRSASESESVETQALGLYPGFTGFSAKVRGYKTGYLLSEENPSSMLIFSFPEGMFDALAETISSGL